MASMILHITTRPQWEDALSHGVYQHPSLFDEGFIHCSTAGQIVCTANRYYCGQSNLVLLCIRSNRLKAALVYEDSYSRGEEFPHIYGPLNLNAVSHVLDFPANKDGTFTLPGDFPKQCGEIEEPVDPGT